MFYFLAGLCNTQTPVEPQKEALNLSETTNSQSPIAMKREQPETRESPPPPKKFSKDEDESSRHNNSLPSTHIKINSRGKCKFIHLDHHCTKVVPVIIRKQFTKLEKNVKIDRINLLNTY